MNDIKARIKSVSGTMQITKAMELVAISKLRRAKERVEQSRPYYNLIEEAIKTVEGSSDVSGSVWFAPKESEKTLYVVIAGDRGLAGGYNSNVFKLARPLLDCEGGVSVLPVGKKAKEFYLRRKFDVKDLDLGVVADVGVGDCIRAGEKITKLILVHLTA